MDPALVMGPSPEEIKAETQQTDTRGGRHDGGRGWADAAGAQEGASLGAPGRKQPAATLLLEFRPPDCVGTTSPP